MVPKEDSDSRTVNHNSSAIAPHYFLVMAGRMMPLLALFGATILYAHLLPPDDYGSYQSVWMYANLVSVILGFGVTIIIFSSQTSQLVEFLRTNKKVIITFYTLLWIFTFILFSIASHQYSLSLKMWVIAFMIFQASNTITETWLIRNDGEIRYCVINIIYSIVFFGWHYLVLYSGYSLEWLVQGIVFFSLLKFLSLLLSVKNLNKTYSGKTSSSGFLHHWVYNGINDIIGVLSKWIDKLILIYLLTPSEFAIFFNGSIEIPLFSIFVSFTGSLMMAQMARRMKERDSVIPVFRKNFLMLSAVSFPLFFFLLFFSKSIFLVFFGQHYLSSVPIFLITILIIPLRINTYGSVLQVMKKGKIVTQGSVLDLAISTLLVFILYPWLGMRGAAMALVISTVIQITFYLFHTRRLLRTSYLQMIPFRKLAIRFIICGILFWFLQSIIKNFSPIINIVSGCILIFGCIAIVGRSYFIQILRTEKNQ